MIKYLKEIGRNEVDLFGGKAANLGFLLQKGFNVPSGFCISTKLNKLADEMVKTILDKFESLNSAVSVRSSATVEDLSKTSFAGLFDTFLNIKSKDELIEAIRKCKNSIHSKKVKTYAKEKKIKNIKMAVIVQKMIESDFSGVIFTLEPIDKKCLLIELATGLGDNVVSGRITPSSFYIDKSSDKIIKKENLHGISESLVLDIAQIGKKIGDLYGNPQDVEFAVKNNEVFILQSRPITT